jgi:hypothetical protein
MAKFLDAWNQPKLNQEAINNLNSPTTCNEIEIDLKRPSLDRFMAEFYQIFKELTKILKHFSRK